jgi:hypothetical protein
MDEASLSQTQLVPRQAVLSVAAVILEHAQPVQE